MSGKIITVAQQKGGAGKTTLVAHLAVALQQAGLSTALIDIDPQGSLSYWYKARRETLGEDADDIVHRQISGWRTQREVEELAKEHDVVLVDSAPHAEMETKTAIRSAALVLVPVQPSPMDFWATQPTLELAKSEKVTPLLVLNRVPPRATLSEVIEKKLKKLDAKVAKAQLGNRVGLAAAMLEGRTVSETQRRSVGAQEVKRLAREVYKAAGGDKRLR